MVKCIVILHVKWDSSRLHWIWIWFQNCKFNKLFIEFETGFPWIQIWIRRIEYALSRLTHMQMCASRHSPGRYQCDLELESRLHEIPCATADDHAYSRITVCSISFHLFCSWKLHCRTFTSHKIQISTKGAIFYNLHIPFSEILHSALSLLAGWHIGPPANKKICATYSQKVLIKNKCQKETTFTWETEDDFHNLNKTYMLNSDGQITNHLPITDAERYNLNAARLS